MQIAGTLCRLRWPFTDLAAAKTRPALILSEADVKGDIEVAMVTSFSAHPASLPITTADYAEGKLPKESYVRTDRILKVRESVVQPLTVRVVPQFVLAVRKAIIRLDSRKFSKVAHAANRPGYDSEQARFVPGETTVPYAGRVFTEDEVEAAVSATLDFWLTLGPEGDAFEKELASSLGVKRSLLVNSGSSANLLAFSALTSHKLGDRAIRPGDEVITCAAGFPTTVAPIIQNGAVPVFVDADPITLNAPADLFEEAYVPGKTKAVMMAHTLGNPFDLERVTEFCRKHDLWLIEDNCDALGSTYTHSEDHPGGVSFRRPLSNDGTPIAYPTGSFGDLSTQSFYPPHHLTLGEGGAVNIVRDMRLKVLVESFRDWGRDCWCASGKDNTCGKRFGWQLGELPEGYDHKYIYGHLGYNLKPLDIQAAIGRQQMRKLPAFGDARRANWEYLRRGLADLDEFFEFQLPTHAKAWTPEGFVWASDRGPRCSPSWFGFMMRVRESAPFTRTDLARSLDGARVGNRMLFGGNLVRQPAFVELRKSSSQALRIAGELNGADKIMRSTIFIGTYPGMSREMLDYMVETIANFARSR